jgi:hypothetical protein
MMGKKTAAIMLKILDVTVQNLVTHVTRHWDFCTIHSEVSMIVLFNLLCLKKVRSPMCNSGFWGCL